MNFQYRFHIRSKPRGSNGSDEENVKSLGPVALLLKGQDLPVKSDDDKEVHPVPNKQHYNRKIYPRVIRMQCCMPSRYFCCFELLSFTIHCSLTYNKQWQLCPMEGPYRMRKKLECCRLKTDTIQNILDGQFELEIPGSSEGKVDHGSNASNSKPYFPLLNDGAK
ncbi:hypothetical protein KIW84_042717 [Lathyrus oleraceus]|uniref:Uncharacterized protein n=1 Tax=Pisum sativum TaxID=3888 RepID=A0A9D4XD93_PEA|nr:hypothetical protein KIW84_042717 [Pisum sativum]